MLQNILSNFNWLDLVLLIVIIRAIFIGATQGLVVEFFKILGMLLATVGALHYYTRATEALCRLLPSLPVEWTEIVCFLIFWGLAVLLFKFAREGWLLLFKMEAKQPFSQWGGGIVAVFRGFLICSMILFLLFLTGNRFLSRFAEESFAGRYLRDLSPQVYQGTFEGLVVKFFPDEPNNFKAVNAVENKEDITGQTGQKNLKKI